MDVPMLNTKPAQVSRPWESVLAFINARNPTIPVTTPEIQRHSTTNNYTNPNRAENQMNVLERAMWLFLSITASQESMQVPIRVQESPAIRGSPALSSSTENIDGWVTITHEERAPKTFYRYSPDEPYLTFTIQSPAVKRLVFHTWSHDQGWSDNTEHVRTYRNSWTWFEVDTIPSFALIHVGPGHVHPRRHVLQHNLHGSNQTRHHTNVWDADDSPSEDIRTWMRGLRQGSVVAVFAKAEFPGWENHVQGVKVEVEGRDRQ